MMFDVFILIMQFGCCSAGISGSSTYYYSSPVRIAAITCGVQACSLPNSEKVNKYTLTTIILALIFATGFWQ